MGKKKRTTRKPNGIAKLVNSDVFKVRRVTTKPQKAKRRQNLNKEVKND